MTLDPGILEKMLDGRCVGPSLGVQSHFMRLEESDLKATLKRIDIKEVPEQSLLIRMDQIPPPLCLREDYRQRCDYVLVTREVIVFVELKSSERSSSSAAIARQFKGATALLEYIGAASRLFLNKEPWSSEHRKGYVVVRGGIGKRVTALRASRSPNTAPDAPATLVVPSSRERMAPGQFLWRAMLDKI